VPASSSANPRRLRHGTLLIAAPQRQRRTMQPMKAALITTACHNRGDA